MNTKLINVLKMLICAAVGLLLVVFPQHSLKMSVILLGIGLIVLGIIMGLSYLLKKEKETKDLFSLILGILMIGAGIADLFMQETVLKIFPTIAGLLVVAGAAAGVIQVIREKKKGENWKYLLAVSIASAALGAVMFIQKFDEGTIVRMLGTALLYLGAVGIVSHLDDKNEPAPENTASPQAPSSWQ